MRILRLSLFLILLLVYCDPPMLPQKPASAEDEIRSVMAQIRIASLEGDTDKVSKLLTDEYVQTDISGHVQDKEMWLKEYFNPLADLIRSRKFRWETFERKDLQFRIYGASAVVIGVLEARGTGAKWVPESHTWVADSSAGFNGTIRFTHVYVKRNGRWLLAVLHNAIPVSSAPAK